ncbi:metal ABC transporter substrate-binding protein [Halanaerobium hydrogeniformans]|uniref:Periplasmic solute binding protein n=1 Tax=Halanaerobium hydrogeniformans TaxID=656519 RepID=E4RNS4_HALHG|nr:zinc ABC transporter substrate-binding protein [Halanaerobium hydrogeniformans]ADQ13752.1 periplasmic solute binding protein [Halanaerobium hydrogeniformans]
MKKILFFLFLFSLLILPLSNVQAAGADVHVSIYPIYEIAERVGGERLNINQVTPDGVEVHGFEPSPRVLAQLENTDLFIYIGQQLQGWTENVADNLRDEGIKVIDLTEHVDLIEYDGHHHHDDHHHEHEEDAHHDHHEHEEDAHHDHHEHEEDAHHDHHEHEEDAHHDHHEDGHHHDHSHGEYDNHIWLDFNNMIVITELMVEEFSQLDPEGEEVYRANGEAVIEELKALDQAYEEGLQDLKNDTIIVSHAAFGYLAENYGLKQRAVTGLDPHSEPSSQTIRELIDLSRETGQEYIFLEVLASPRAVNVVAEEAGLEILTLNPAAGLREEDIENNENYFTIMYDNLENLKKALK